MRQGRRVVTVGHRLHVAAEFRDAHRQASAVNKAADASAKAPPRLRDIKLTNRGKRLIGRLGNQGQPARPANRGGGADIVDAVHHEAGGLVFAGQAAFDRRQLANVFFAQTAQRVRMRHNIAASVDHDRQHASTPAPRPPARAVRTKARPEKNNADQLFTSAEPLHRQADTGDLIVATHQKERLELRYRVGRRVKQ